MITGKNGEDDTGFCRRKSHVCTAVLVVTYEFWSVIQVSRNDGAIKAHIH